MLDIQIRHSSMMELMENQICVMSTSNVLALSCTKSLSCLKRLTLHSILKVFLINISGIISLRSHKLVVTSTHSQQ